MELGGGFVMRVVIQILSFLGSVHDSDIFRFVEVDILIFLSCEINEGLVFVIGHN